MGKLETLIHRIKSGIQLSVVNRPSTTVKYFSVAFTRVGSHLGISSAGSNVATLIITLFFIPESGSFECSYPYKGPFQNSTRKCNKTLLYFFSSYPVVQGTTLWSTLTQREPSITSASLLSDSRKTTMTSISIASWRSAANRIQDRAVTEAVKQAEGEGDQSRKISALKYALDHWATRAWWTSRMVCVIACLSQAAIPPQQLKVLLPSTFIFNGWLHFRISLCQALGQSKWAKKVNEKRKKRASSPHAVFRTFFFDPFSPHLRI